LRRGFKPGAAAYKICGDSVQGDGAWLEGGEDWPAGGCMRKKKIRNHEQRTG